MEVRAPARHRPEKTGQTPWQVFQRAMQELLTHEDAEAARATLLESLQAVRWMRSGPREWSQVPDYAVRSTTAVRVLEWVIGRPVERHLISESSDSGAERPLTVPDLVALVRGNPSLASRILEDIVINAQPVEREVVAQDREQSK